jgi:YVTN family beta-propeller protein
MKAFNACRSGATTLVALAILFLTTVLASAASGKSKWLSPSNLGATPDGTTLFVTCATGDRVLMVDTSKRSVANSVDMPAPPTGLAVSADGKTLFVTCAGSQSRICVVDVLKARVTDTLPAGHTAMGPVLSPDGKFLFVCNRFEDDISVINLATRKEVRRIPVQREPVAAAITPDGKWLLVANHLHNGRADADIVAAVVSVIDPVLGKVVKELKLPNGSGSLNDIRVSPDGKYAVVTHILSRYPLPTTQLDRGWVNTNAKTLIALEPMELLNTVLLDTVDRGAANPWGAAWSADGKKLVVALAGTHEVSVTEFPALLEKLATLSRVDPASGKSAVPYTAASRSPGDVPNDLSFLVGVRERTHLPEGDLGPRGIIVVGGLAFTANYFSDSLSAVEIDGDHPKSFTISLGPKPAMSPARQGELYFNDARICFQSWHTCATCHPGDARVDALNWDLLNDGIGNPKNTKSMLLTFETPPAMSIGVRESAYAAVRAGIQHILFTVQPPEVGNSLDAYLKALKPVPSPALVNGKLSPAAKRGEKLFHKKEVGCAQCHPGPLFTDLQSYDVGTRGRSDRDAVIYDTPSLVELWRTAPYLHDGSAATLHDVLTVANQKDQHGTTSRLSPDQVKDLVEYLRSL